MNLTADALVTRRVLNRAILVGAALPLVTPLLMACGTDDEAPDGDAAPGGGVSVSSPEAPTSATGSDPTETVGTRQTNLPELDHAIVSVAGGVTTLDPHMEATGNFPDLVQSFENLILIDENLEVVPALAESWEMIDDTTWEFRLREGVKFHNGAGMTSADIVYSLERVMRDGVESGPRKKYIDWFESVEAMDEYTIRIHTLGPYPAAVSASHATLVIPENYFEEVGAEGMEENPVGTGPYKIVSWTLNERIEVEAFSDYWGGAPYLPRGTFRIITEESTSINELLTGGINGILGLSANRVPDLEDNEDVVLTSAPAVLNLYLGMNTYEISDVRVRKAIAHAINVPLMIETILSGYGEHANSLVHSTSFGWDPDLPFFAYDPELSKSLLAEAGYADGFETVIMGGPGVFPVSKETGEAISGFLSEVGINAPMQFLEWGDYFDRYLATELKGLFLFGKNAKELDAQLHLHQNFHCPPGGRGLYWCSPETDELIDSAGADLDPESRLESMHEVQRILYEQVVGVPLWQYEEVLATSPNLNLHARGDFFVKFVDVQPMS